MRINSISIIFPFYNEESRLNQCFKDINAFNKNNKKKDKEYIFVDDGSNDNSLKLVKHFINKQNNKKVKYKLISIKKNTGKGFALKKGVRAAKKKWILTLDTDISVSLSQINIWIKKNYINNKKKEIYFGSRNVIGSIVNYKFHRKIFGSIFNFLIKNFLKIKILDTQCGYKLYPNLLAKKIFFNLNEKGFIHDLELVVLCNNQKITIKELPIKWTHIPNSKLNLFKDSIKMFIGIFRLKIKFKI
tara:strand:- start:1626 stop:2360 length:735 start_codon:yes stop_codon:yes gene_type:complete